MKKIQAVLLVVLLCLGMLIVVFPIENVTASGTENSWETLAPMPTARALLAAAALNGKVYAIGGIARNGSESTDNIYLGTNEMYDPALNTWATKSPMPTPRFGFGAVAYGGKIYCIGGNMNDGLVHRLSTNEAYDPATDSWTAKTPMPSQRARAAVACVNGKIYVIGGMTPTSGRSSNNEMYNPDTDSWAIMAPMPHALDDCACASIGNKIYVFGEGETDYKADLNTVQIYDANLNTWVFGPNLPYSISGGVVVATSGVNAPSRVYVMASAVMSSDSKPVLQVFNPPTSTWSTGKEYPTLAAYLPRTAFAGAILGDLIYAFGGFEGHDSNENNRYTPFGYSSSPLPTNSDSSPSPTTSDSSPTPTANQTNMQSPTPTVNTDTFQYQTNSTSVSPFVYDPKNMELTFNVTGPSGTTGYMNVTIPKSFLSDAENIKVYIDGKAIEHQTVSNPTSWFLSFTYSHSTHQVKITFPEKAAPLNFTVAGAVLGTVLLAAVLATVIVLARKKKLNKPEKPAA
jgi:hypothetical protein